MVARDVRGWWCAWLWALCMAARLLPIWAATALFGTSKNKQREQAQNACPPRGIVFGMRCARALRTRTCYLFALVVDPDFNPDRLCLCFAEQTYQSNQG